MTKIGGQGLDSKLAGENHSGKNHSGDNHQHYTDPQVIFCQKRNRYIVTANWAEKDRHEREPKKVEIVPSIPGIDQIGISKEFKRAILGKASTPIDLIVDGTGGWLGDASRLFALARRFVVFEQLELLQRLHTQNIKHHECGFGFQNCQINTGKLQKLISNEVYPQLGEQEARVLYLDPMFEDDKKSLAKKEMQLLRGLELEDLASEKSGTNRVDWKDLIKTGQRLGFRVVVKRGRKTPLICENLRPDGQVFSKLARYDIYGPRH